MDELISYGVLAVALFLIIVTCIAGGVLYGLYMVVTAIITGNYTTVVQPLLFLIVLTLAYGSAGILMVKLGII
jgi:hypothetical protein